MKVTKKKIDDLQFQLSIAVAADDYAANEKKKLADRRRTAEFKGFRKGMVPMSLIQRVYGDQALVEAVNEVVSHALSEYITKNKLNLLGEPLTSEKQEEIEWKSGNDFTFKFDLATAPEVNLEPGKEDKVTYYKIEVTEKARKEMKENMLRQMGSLQEGKKAGEDDYLVCDMTNGTVSVEGTYVSVRNVAEEGRALFKGKKAGDKFDVDVNLAFTNETDRAAMLKIKKDQLKDLDPLFHVTVVNVKTFVSAEANQETFDKLFGPDKVHNDEEFTAAVEERLVENYKQEADYRFGKDLKKYLVEKAAVTLPEDFLKRWLVYINEGKFTAEQIEAEFPSFIEDFKWQTVRSSLMEKYGLKVEEKDLQEAAEAFAAYQYAMYGMGGVPQEMIREAAQRVLADERQRRQIEENVEDQKVITAVREVVTLANKKITVEKFRELK